MCAYFVLPSGYRFVTVFNQKRSYQFSVRLERVIPRVQAKNVVHLYMIHRDLLIVFI